MHRLLSELHESEAGIGRIEEFQQKQQVFLERLIFHLSNPLTFRNKLPRTGSKMHIIRTPDGKYKFYSYYDGGYMTFVQYLDDSGKVVFRPWQEKVRFDYTKLYIKFWQFQQKGTTYYVAKSYKRGSSLSSSYGMEIFTLADGQPTYSIDFYPKGVYEPHEYKMVDLSLKESEYYAPAYDVTVCYTDCGNEIVYSFDPKTKTVNITEYDESLGRSESKKVNRSWKLVNVE